jgi:hypothetical protein
LSVNLKPTLETFGRLRSSAAIALRVRLRLERTGGAATVGVLVALAPGAPGALVPVAAAGGAVGLASGTNVLLLLPPPGTGVLNEATPLGVPTPVGPS